MKIFVEHDSDGIIHAVAVPVAGSARTVLRSGPGHQVSEVDASEVQNEKDYESLQKIKQHHRVEGYGQNAKLVRKA